MNVIIKIKVREAIPVRALPLLAGWGTMNPEKIAGALGPVTDDDRRPLFDNLHDMNAYYVEDGTVHPVTAQNWRDHTCRELEALNDQLKHTEISHATGYVEWQVKALEKLPKEAFVWKDEYEPIYDRAYGPQTWANLSDVTQKALTARCKEPPPALNFRPDIANERMETLVQAALDAIRMAANTLQQVPQVTIANPAPLVTGGPAPEIKEQRQDRRLKACEDAGLTMPKSYRSRLPDGVGIVADRAGVTRQAFSTDVKAALKRRESAIREGATVHYS